MARLAIALEVSSHLGRREILFIVSFFMGNVPMNEPSPIIFCELDEIPSNHPVAVFARRWFAMAVNGRPPPWSMFDAIDHPSLLPWILLMRPNGDGGFYYAVAGTGCEEIYGLRFQGKPFGEGLPADAIEDRLDEFDATAAAGKPLFSSTRLPVENKSWIEVCRGVFPFLSANGSVERMLVIVSPVEQRLD